MKQTDFVERLTQALDLRVRASRHSLLGQSAYSSGLQAKLTLDNPARVWYNKGTKCDDVDGRRYITS